MSKAPKSPEKKATQTLKVAEEVQTETATSLPKKTTAKFEHGFKVPLEVRPNHKGAKWMQISLRGKSRIRPVSSIVKMANNGPITETHVGKLPRKTAIGIFMTNDSLDGGVNQAIYEKAKAEREFRSNPDNK